MLILVSSYGFGSGFLIIGLTGLFAGVIALTGPSSTNRRLEAISE
jgi:hypothetical protein